MSIDRMVWSVFNSGVVPKARNSYQNIHSFRPLGEGAPVGGVPRALEELATRANQGLKDLKMQAPPPADVATLAFFDDQDAVFRAIRQKINSYYYGNMVLALILSVLFVLGGVIVLWSVFQTPEFIKIASGASLSAVAGVLLTKPYRMWRDAVFLNTQMMLILYKYDPQLRACKEGKDLKIDAILNQAINCVSSVIDRMIKDLQDLASH